MMNKQTEKIEKRLVKSEEHALTEAPEIKEEVDESEMQLVPYSENT